MLALTDTDTLSKYRVQQTRLSASVDVDGYSIIILEDELGPNYCYLHVLSRPSKRERASQQLVLDITLLKYLCRGGEKKNRLGDELCRLGEKS